MCRRVLCVAALLSGVPGWSGAGSWDNLAWAHGRVFPRPNTVFVRDGRTTLNEVLDVLRPFETDASTADFFWARWLPFRSPPVREAAASVQNFIVEFDWNGIAVHSALYSDAKALPVLWREAGQFPDLQDAFAVPAWYWEAVRYLKGSPHRGTLQVRREDLRFEPDRGAFPAIGLSPARVRRITSEEDATDERLRLSLHFRKTPGAPRRIKIEASPLETMRLMRVLKSAAAAVETR